MTERALPDNGVQPAAARRKLATSLIFSACASTVIVGAGCLALRLETKNILPPSFALVGCVLQFPGLIVAGLVSSLFVSGGVHSIAEVFWLMPPVSWLAYFVLFARLFSRPGSGT
jgi:hypothetical protein